MKSELQVQLETALLGNVKSLCHILKDLKVELGSVQMKIYLGVAKESWIRGARWVMTEVAAQADNISLEDLKALADED